MKSTAKHTEKLVILLLPEHKAALDAIAQLDSESISIIVRRLIRMEAKARGLWRVFVEDNDAIKG